METRIFFSIGYVKIFLLLKASDNISRNIKEFVWVYDFLKDFINFASLRQPVFPNVQYLYVIIWFLGKFPESGNSSNLLICVGKQVESRYDIENES